MDAKTFVVKVGTRVLTDSSGRIDLHRIKSLAEGLNAIADSGRRAVLVSSGAVAAGVAKLNLPHRPTNLAALQAVAAVGQTDLIRIYERYLAAGGRHAAQVLLTAADLRRRSGYLNVRNTLAKIHDLRCIPVINENDSVAVAELMTTFGDNDSLAAAVDGLYNDSVLVILSDVAGLYDGPPTSERAKVIDVVQGVTDAIRSLAQPHDSRTSRGGMISKIEAAAKANSHGHAAIIAPGTDDRVLQKILAGQSVGTLFRPDRQPIRGRRRWIRAEAEVAGRLVVDRGAVAALTDTGASLLAVGMTAVIGNFRRGDVVDVVDDRNKIVAKGLVNYPSAEAAKLCGHQAHEIESILGHRPDEAVVHRDNLVLVDG